MCSILQEYILKKADLSCQFTRKFWNYQGTKVDFVIDSKILRKLYYGYASLRPSCYECLYKSVRHPGDITREYYWEIEKAVPEFDANEGVSLVLVNNEYGEKYLIKLKKKLYGSKQRWKTVCNSHLSHLFQNQIIEMNFGEIFIISNLKNLK